MMIFNTKFNSNYFLFVLFSFVTFYVNAQDKSLLWKNEPYGTFDMQSEVVELRTISSKHFRNGDGTLTAHFSAGELHYWEDNQWKTIFHTILPTSSGFENNSNFFKTTYPAFSTGALSTRINGQGEVLEMLGMKMYYEGNEQVFNERSISHVHGGVDVDKLVYSSAFGDGIDLRFKQNSTNRKLDYVIQNSNSFSNVPGNMDFLVFEEQVELPTNWKAILVNNEIFIYNDKNQLAYKYNEPFAYDSPKHEKKDHVCSHQSNHSGSTHERNEEKKNRIFKIKYELNQVGNRVVIRTKVDLKWLKSSDRQFPIIIDPTANYTPNATAAWTGTLQSWAGYGGTNVIRSSNDWIGIGKIDDGDDDVLSGWARFNTAGIPDCATITSASLWYKVYFNATTDPDCTTMIRTRQMANDPVTATNADLLTDIRNGVNFSNADWAIKQVNYENGTNYWFNKSLNANARTEIQNRLSVDWFAVGLEMYSHTSGHADCWIEFRGQSSGADRIYLRVTYTDASTAPTAITGGGNYCHGQNITLNSTGGTNGSDVAHVWYRGGCNNAFTQTWGYGNPYGLNTTTVNSNTNGILNVTSTSGDPMINMFSLGSFNPAVYRYLNIRYRVTSGTAGSVEAFFLNSTYPAPNGACYTATSLLSDNQWHIASIDMHQNGNYTTGGNITGWRYDWCTANGVTMDLDFIQLSEFPMLDEDNSSTELFLNYGSAFYPASGVTTYAAAKIDNCATTCASTSVTLPNTSATLGNNNDQATCVVNQNGWVHFYHSTGRLLASVNSGGNNLGNVTVTSYDDGAPVSVFACDEPTDPVYRMHTMERHWLINPTTNGSAKVRLPFYTSEYDAMATAANGNANPNDQVTGVNTVRLSKYSGGVSNTNEDANAPNNCPGAGGTGNTIVVLQDLYGTSDLSAFPQAVGASSYVEYSISGFSEFWLHGASSSPLPVELVSFSGNCMSSGVQLDWTTASEQNNAYFEVQRSRDLQLWETIAHLNSVGNSSQLISYQYIDQEALEAAYYRIIQVDYNGDHYIKNTVYVTCSGSESTVSVYPNPTQADFTVKVNAEKMSENARIILFDVTGKRIIDRPIAISKGVNEFYFDTVLETGSYLVKVFTDFQEFEVVKFVVKH